MEVETLQQQLNKKADEQLKARIKEFMDGLWKEIMQVSNGGAMLNKQTTFNIEGKEFKVWIGSIHTEYQRLLFEAACDCNRERFSADFMKKVNDIEKTLVGCMAAATNADT